MPIAILVLALILGGFSLFGDNSNEKLIGLKRGLEVQQQKNQVLETDVARLRHEARGLQTDPRVIEKAARNMLGMSRPNEKIFIFEKQIDEKK